MLDDFAGDLLPGLIPGAFRGVVFHVPDAYSAAGRRVAEYLFPGVDPAAYDDFGKLPREIEIEGIMVGDDYVARAAALEAVFETPGPGTLLHPWLGPMTVIMVEPGEVSFSAGELRVARFNVRFRRVDDVAGGGFAGALSTAAGLAAAASSLRLAAGGLARKVGGLPLAAVTRAATRSLRVAGAVWAAAAARRPAARLAPALPRNPGGVAGFAAASAAMAARLMSSADAMRPRPAVSPSAEAVAVAPPPARAVLAALLSAGRALTLEAGAAPSGIDRALLAAAAAEALAAAAELAGEVDYETRQEAGAARVDVDRALGHLMEAGDAIGLPALGNAAAALTERCAALSAAVAADINEAIGRLPEVAVFTLRRPASAYLIAQHLYGDRPELVQRGYEAIVARNRPRHPGELPAGPVEVLKWIA